MKLVVFALRNFLVDLNLTKASVKSVGWDRLFRITRSTHFCSHIQIYRMDLIIGYYVAFQFNLLSSWLAFRHCTFPFFLSIST